MGRKCRFSPVSRGWQILLGNQVRGYQVQLPGTVRQTQYRHGIVSAIGFSSGRVSTNCPPPRSVTIIDACLTRGARVPDGPFTRGPRPLDLLQGKGRERKGREGNNKPRVTRGGRVGGPLGLVRHHGGATKPRTSPGRGPASTLWASNGQDQPTLPGNIRTPHGTNQGASSAMAGIRQHCGKNVRKPC